MKLVLGVLALTSIFEVLLFIIPLFWRMRKLLASVLLLTLATLSGLLLGYSLRIWAVIFLVLSLYRIINLLRVASDRTHQKHLQKTGRNTALWLIGGQLLILGLAYVQSLYAFSFATWISFICILQLCIALILLTSTLRHLRTTQPPTNITPRADRDLPTVTVAIPARNETEDLEQCLESLIGSNYPKMEILVLDDCSQEKRTPEIIRGYAHDGVRFLSGKPAGTDWLAKNYAYQQLAEASSGDIILFCGVDARFTSESLRLLVCSMLDKNKTMLSVIPKNRVSKNWRYGLSSLQVGRYAWEIALPRRFLRRPPVLSTCWLISRKSLKQAGGFSAVKHSISPESYFARYIVNNSDDYTFMQSNEDIGVTSVKSIYEQRATAVRTRYPQLHQRPELVCLFGLLELAVLLGPLLFIILGIVISAPSLVATSIGLYILLIIFYVMITKLTYRTFLWRSLWLLPIAAIYDIALLNYSMWQYEFEEVIWKDRNVCVPVMRTYASLPKLP